jgi:hypothetical protein
MFEQVQVSRNLWLRNARFESGCYAKRRRRRRRMIRTRRRTILANTKGPHFLVVAEDWLCFDYRQQTAIWSRQCGGGGGGGGAGGVSGAARVTPGLLLVTTTDCSTHILKKSSISSSVQSAGALCKMPSGGIVATRHSRQNLAHVHVPHS